MKDGFERAVSGIHQVLGAIASEGDPAQPSAVCDLLSCALHLLANAQEALLSAEKEDASGHGAPPSDEVIEEMKAEVIAAIESLPGFNAADGAALDATESLVGLKRVRTLLLRAKATLSADQYESVFKGFDLVVEGSFDMLARLIGQQRMESEDA